MAPSEGVSHNSGSSALSSHAAACLSPDPRILRGQISQQLAELSAKEKQLLDPIFRKRLELNRLWNASLLIHKLPNELLVQIFTHFPKVPPNPPRPPLWSAPCDHGARGRTGWHRLMLVCLHWRTVILSTTTFWRQIDLQRNAKWTSLCLARSAAASIDVTIGRRIVTPVEALHPHTYRFKTFCLDPLHNPQLKTALAPLFESCMPLLEALNLDVPREPDSDSADSSLTSQRYPCLRSLVLRGTVAPANVSLFAQLRALSLSSCSYHFSFDVFLDMLAASLQLEDLTLSETLFFPSDEWAYSSAVPFRPPISLPRLRKLTMRVYGLLRTSHFLAHLHLPPSVSLIIQCEHGAEPTDVGTLGAMLPPNRTSTLPILAIATKVVMEIWGEDYEFACDALLPSPSQGAVSSADPHAFFSLLYSDEPQWDQCMTQGLEDLVECFGRSPLTHLTVTGDQDYGTAEVWETVFRTFPTLEELKVDGDFNSRVTKVFRGLHAASTDSADSSVACRNLKRVGVEGLGMMETYVAMEECLRYRTHKGVRLQILDLKNLSNEWDLTGQIYHAFVKDLAEVVDCVEASHRQSDDEEEGEDEE